MASMRAVCLTLTAALTAIAAAQAAPPADAANALAKLIAYGQQYRATLPSLECHESIVIQQLKKGRVKKEMNVEGTFRVVSGGPANNPFAESHRYATVDGKPAPEHFGMAFFLSGAFANGVGFRADTQNCYAYALEPAATPGQEIMVSATRSDSASIPGCQDAVPGSVKRTTFNAGTGQVFKVSVQTPAEIAERLKRPFFAEIEYAPVHIGEADYLLPMHVSTRTATDDRRFDVRYSAFHRFAATVRVLPLDPEPQP